MTQKKSSTRKSRSQILPFIKQLMIKSDTKVGHLNKILATGGREVGFRTYQFSEVQMPGGFAPGGR